MYWGTVRVVIVVIGIVVVVVFRVSLIEGKD